jgi:hypothetical protein
MLEVLTALGVMTLLSVVWSLHRINRSVNRLDDNLGRLQQSLFVRLADPGPDQLKRLPGGVSICTRGCSRWWSLQGPV